MSAVRKSRARKTDLVFGLGATGLSVARYLKREGGAAVFADTRSEPPGRDALADIWSDAELLLGEVELPDGVGRVIVSPGIPDDHPLLGRARDAGLEVVSDVELFARHAGAPFVAVTGSNGKSTVTTLIWHMCQAAGRRALAGGNLGTPALDLLGEDTPDLYVLELSSFQLARTAALPAAVAVLLNVSPDHLDWHGSETAYRAAKYRIFREADAAVVNRADPVAAEHAADVERSVSFGADEPADGHYGLRVEDGVTYLARGDTLLLAASELRLFGRHNQQNALAALAAGDLLGLDPRAMLQVLVEFPGLPHRMQLVARKGSVDYVDDSKATNVGAAIASIESVTGMVVWLAGGVGKGSDYAELARTVEPKLRAAVLFGADAQAIAAALDTLSPVYFAADMDDAVRQARAYAEPGDTVLLAPACASFDQYENYAARGDAFRAAVEGLSR